MNKIKSIVPGLISRYPFSFVYSGKKSEGLLDAWSRKEVSDASVSGKAKDTTVWTDPETGLRVTCELTRCSDFPAFDWILFFENTGTADTAIIENIQVLDIALQSPMSEDNPWAISPSPYRLHKTQGSHWNPAEFEATTVVINEQHSEALAGGEGCPSQKDFPFFKVETAEASLIIAVGWSGQWQAQLQCSDNKQLHVTAGMELTHFLLHPGEKVRSPRVLVFAWKGDTLESNAQFRQLIYQHYAARRDGQIPLPILFCNTCFTRGGGWLNECNAENQISLIKAYAPLGVEAVITDAGWFEGGWPDGAGNWFPRKDAYPEGMGPVAAAAKKNGMVYGLWFEPERAMAGTWGAQWSAGMPLGGATWLFENHPEWLLDSGIEGDNVRMVNFGLPEVQDYFFKIVKDFMELPGFRVYRQDMNTNPLPYWRHNDAPDRQGITEMKYVEGLYAFWDRIAEAWPDSLREECAGGGRRIDLETVMRMHIHQKTDYWFNDDVDQAMIWGLSQYLPNNVIVAHLNRLDEYSFHATMASSLCLGWVADDPGFDFKEGKRLLDRYRQVRHLLVGAWYSLLPYSRDPSVWMASQYHRPDLEEGMILVFRHAESPYPIAELQLHALDSEANYEVCLDRTGESVVKSGAELMAGLSVNLPQRRTSDLIVYHRVRN